MNVYTGPERLGIGQLAAERPAADEPARPEEPESRSLTADQALATGHRAR